MVDVGNDRENETNIPHGCRRVWFGGNCQCRRLEVLQLQWHGLEREVQMFHLPRNRGALRNFYARLDSYLYQKFFIFILGKKAIERTRFTITSPIRMSFLQGEGGPSWSLSRGLPQRNDKLSQMSSSEHLMANYD